MRGLLRLCVIAGLVLAWGNSALAQCVFVNTNSDPNTVAAFTVNPDGSLTAVAGSPFATGGSGAFDAAVGSTGLCVGDRRLYVTNPSSDNVSGFDIADDCTLTTITGSPWAAGNSPLGVAADTTGSFLYVANFLGDSMSVYAMAADGSLTEIAGSPFATPSTPFDIEFDPAGGGRFFVSHDFAGAVGSYTAAGDGTFSPVAGSPFAAGGFEHGLTLNPGASRLYVADFGPDTISGYSIDGSGVLTPLAGSPFAATVEPIEVLTDPSDSFLYATNDNAENIAGFSIDGSGGLTPLAGSPFASDATGPAGLAMDPMGDFLYVANGGFSGSADVSVFTIALDGSLTPIAGSPFATGGTGNATGIAYLPGSDPADVFGTKTVFGSFVPNGTITYTVTLTNTGVGEQGDNAGHEFVDVLPTSLLLLSASVISGGGTIGTDVPSRTVTWDGTIASAASVVIEIRAQIIATMSQVIENEGQINYDSTGMGINDMSRGTEPPPGGGNGAPTAFSMAGAPAVVPTTSTFGFAFLFLLLVGMPLWRLRRSRI